MTTFDWIKNYLPPDSPVKKITDFIPESFDNYFLINWNYGIIDNFPFDSYPADKDSIANINGQVNIDRQFGVFLKNTFQDSAAEKLYRKTTLKEIASRFNVPHSADTISKIKSTPGLAPLPTATIDNIQKLIELIGQDTLYLYIHDNDRYSWQDNWAFKKENIITDKQQYIKFLTKTVFDSVSYLFNDRHSWCLATMEDFGYFILCADNSTADKLKLIPDLEIFKTDSDYGLW